MNEPTAPAAPSTPPSDAADATPSLTRRGFLRGAAVAGAGLAVAACAPAASNWVYPAGPTPNASGGAAAATPAASSTPVAASPVASPTMNPMGQHDAEAEAVVKRFLGGESETLGAWGNETLTPTVDGDTKVFQLDCSAFAWHIDALKDPVQAVGFNKTVPGPLLRVVEGDKVRAVFRNDLDESTGIHFHGQEVPNAMDGVPFVTQPPILPGASFTYEFVAGPSGSHMYHSHHNATDQVGRGLLGAFIVDPADASQRYDALYGASQEIVWISNDVLGGFTINGRGFPATRPIVAKQGETIVVRFMNEGVMTHPWHLHGMRMHIVARDGAPLGSAAFHCDTLGVNPGERWDAIIECKNPGAWAFHCHILPHAEGPGGMFGMVTALIVQA
jgi:FtsP/CotA-like multicopper oxidase with cupredoxin domain